VACQKQHKRFSVVQDCVTLNYLHALMETVNGHSLISKILENVSIFYIYTICI
jgi:hypothetical protein